MSIITGTKPMKCPECKKIFEATSEWGYRIGTTLYCTYSCMRAAEKRMDEAKKAKEQQKKEAWSSVREYDYEEIQRRRAAGETIKGIANSYGVSSATLSVYLKKMAINEKALQAEGADDELLAPPSLPEIPEASPAPKASAEMAAPAPKASAEPKATTETRARAPKASAEKPQQRSAWKALGMVEMALRWGNFPQGVETELRDALHTIENALECA